MPDRRAQVAVALDPDVRSSSRIAPTICDAHPSGARILRARMGLLRATAIALALAGLLARTTAAAGAPAAGAGASQPVELAAPYEYLGWGDPQPPASVIEQSGIRALTLAFILDRGRCAPEWDGSRPLAGGEDQRAIEAIRAAGGEVDVSFGGWSGRKLGTACSSPDALAAAYENVIETYSLRAIDIDIEHGELSNRRSRARVIAALALVRSAYPELEISITFPSSEAGPEADGLSMISQAASLGFMPGSWTIMPFDFGTPGGSMESASTRAVEALAAELSSAYRISGEEAYEHAGISTMNGDTDDASETVSLQEFEALEQFAAEHRLARLSFWSVNRDRPCRRAAPEEECSGIAQQPFAFTDALATL